VKVYGLLKADVIKFKSESSSFDQSKYHAMVMEKGLPDNLYSRCHASGIDINRRDFYARTVIDIVKHLHEQGYAWMDIKPANFIFVQRNYIEYLIGIDLDHARRLSESIPLEYCEVTWEYASPELAYREDPNDIKSPIQLPAETNFTISTPQQYDIWSLGMTILEIFNPQFHPCHQYNGDIPEIQKYLRSLDQKKIDAFIDSIKSNDLKLVCKFLKSALKRNPSERSSLPQLAEIIRGIEGRGFTFLEKTVDEMKDGIGKISSGMEKVNLLCDSVSSIAEIKEKYKDLEQGIDDLTRALNQQAKDLLELSKIKEDVDRYNNALSTLEEKISKHEKDMRQHQHSSDQKSANYKEKEKELTATLEQFQSEMKALKASAIEHQLALDQMRPILQEMQAKQEKMEMRIDLALSNIANDINQQKDEIQSIEKHILEKEQWMEDERKSDASLNEQMHSKLEECQRDIIDLKSSAEEHQRVLNELESAQKHAQEKKARMEQIYNNPFQNSFYHNFVQQFNAVYLASSVVQTNIVHCEKSGMLGNLGNVLRIVGSYIPMIGLAVQLCGSILSKVDNARQMQMLKNLFDIVTSPGDLDHVVKTVAMDLLEEPSPLDLNKLDKPEVFIEKLKYMLSAVLGNIGDIVDFFVQADNKNRGSMVAAQAAGLVQEKINDLVLGKLEENNQDELNGRRYAERLVTILITRIYNGEAKSLLEISDLNKKANILTEVALDEYVFVPEEALLLAGVIARNVVENSKMRLNATESADAQQEEAFIAQFTESLLKKFYYTSIINEALQHGQLKDDLIQQLVDKFLDNKEIFVANMVEKGKQNTIALFGIHLQFKKKKTSFMITIDDMIEEVFRGVPRKEGRH